VLLLERQRGGWTQIGLRMKWGVAWWTLFVIDDTKVVGSKARAPHDDVGGRPLINRKSMGEDGLEDLDWSCKW
jgi:hypothetical protein